jgi:type I restriction enzyme R subunit
MSYLDEAQVEIVTMDYLRDIGYGGTFGPDISPDLPAPGSSRQAGGPACERIDYDQVVLVGRLQTAIENINPNIPPDVEILAREVGS